MDIKKTSSLVFETIQNLRANIENIHKAKHSK